MAGLLLKAVVVWLMIVAVAFGNALLRDNLLAPAIGSETALPVSGVVLSILIFLVTLGSVPFFNISEGKPYLGIGLIWFALTLSFELLFGRFVAGKPWHEIWQVFNIAEGNLFAVALLSTFLSPWLAAKSRGWI